MEKKLAIGIDIGGTTTKFGIVDNHGHILEQARIPTNEHEVASLFIDDLYAKLWAMMMRHGKLENYIDIRVAGNMRSQQFLC